MSDIITPLQTAVANAEMLLVDLELARKSASRLELLALAPILHQSRENAYQIQMLLDAIQRG